LLDAPLPFVPEACEHLEEFVKDPLPSIRQTGHVFHHYGFWFYLFDQLGHVEKESIAWILPLMFCGQ
jgi:hypothetical protein